MSTPNTNPLSLQSTLRGLYLQVRLASANTLKASIRYREGEQAIVDTRGVDPDATAARIKLYPKGFDRAYRELIQAYNAVRGHFYACTLPFGNNGTKADGDRLIPSDPQRIGMFEAEHGTLMQNLDQARTAFADDIDAIVASLEHHAKIIGWLDFDKSKYPSRDDVLNSYQYAPLQYTPLVDPSQLDGLPLSSDMQERISTQLNQRLEANYRFGIQSEMAALMSYLDNMSQNLTALAEYAVNPDSTGRKKAPRISQTLFTNVQDTLAKIKTYAVPETSEGSRLINVADKISRALAIDSLNPDVVKANPAIAKKAAEKAAAINQAMADWDL